MKEFKIELVVLAVAFALGIPLLWVRALVLLDYLRWFVDPLVRVPRISSLAAMGLLLLPTVWSVAATTDRDDRGPVVRVANGLSQSLLSSVMLWVVGAALHALGRAL